MVLGPESNKPGSSTRVTPRSNDVNSVRDLHQGPRSMAASRGRIHDRSPINLPKHQNSPCREGAVHTCRGVYFPAPPATSDLITNLSPGSSYLPDTPSPRCQMMAGSLRR